MSTSQGRSRAVPRATGALGVLDGQVARCGTDVAKSAVPAHPLCVHSEARRGRSVLGRSAACSGLLRGGTRRGTPGRRALGAKRRRPCCRGSWCGPRPCAERGPATRRSRTRDSPRARSVATSRSRAVAPNASRRTVAERAALARSITIATRPSDVEPGRDAWRVTQLSRPAL